MSHFYGDLQGNRGMATRQGTRASGIDAHARGWNIGARVICRHDAETGLDVVTVYATSGSNHRQSDRLIAMFTVNDLATIKTIS